MTRPDRHHWAVLRHESRPDQVAAEHLAVLSNWINSGRPLVIAGSKPEDAPGTVRLGLSLPDKTRIGMLADMSDLVQSTAPPSPARALAHAPQSWAVKLQALAQAFPGRCGVFGSLGWQVMTGAAYVRADSSDLDVAVAAADAGEADRICVLLAEIDALPGPRLDGEILFGARGAVPWREWFSPIPKVLVKSHGAPALVDRAQWAVRT